MENFDKALRQDFLAFSAKALRKLDGTVINDDRYLEVVASYLDSFAAGSTKKLVVNLPPRHLKTKLCTICLIAWLLAHDPSLKIMVVSYSQELAKDIAQDIRSILEADWFRRTFRTRLAKNKRQARNFGTTAGGQVYADSFEGSLTGFGGSVIVVDDPHNITDVENPKLIDRTIEKFFSVLLSRLDNRKTGRIMVVAHRIHEKDLSAKLLATKGWTHLALPVIAPKTKTYKTLYDSWRRRKGELLRPDADDVKDTKRRRDRPSNPPFELLFQQDAEWQALPAITENHFMPYDRSAIQNLPYFISVDPGTEDGDDRRSFSVVQVWATDGKAHYLVAQFRKRCDFEVLVKKTKKLIQDYLGAPIIVEKTANGPALISALTKNQRRRVYAIVPRESKSLRFRRHVRTVLAGAVHVQQDADFREELVEELVAFPNGDHTDQLDALTQYLDHIEKYRDEIDFSKTNCTRPGIAAGANNSDYQSPALSPPQDPNAPGLIAIGLNSRPQALTWSQRQDPKAPGIIAGGRRAMPNAPFPVVRAWVKR
jgi:predicted phage terminase large subunit-like protein